jgi:ribosome biogenesis protein YTM1
MNLGGLTSHFLSSSKDQTVRLWKNSSEPCFSHVGVGHLASVVSLATAPKETDGNSVQFCSGGFDGSIYLWNSTKGHLNKADIEKESLPSVKKLKKDVKKAEDYTFFKPILQFNGSTTTEVARAHSQAVSGLEQPSEDIVYSASWDHSVKKWDASTGLSVATLVNIIDFFKLINNSMALQ